MIIIQSPFFSLFFAMENIVAQFEIFEQANDAFLLSDVRGQIVVGNCSACEYLEYSAAELSGLKLSDVEFGAATEPDPLEAGLCTTTFQCNDNSGFPVEAQANTIDDPQQGDLLLLIGISRRV